METFIRRTEVTIDIKGDDVPLVVKNGITIAPYKVVAVKARSGQRFMIVTGHSGTYIRSLYFDIGGTSSYEKPPRWLFQLMVKFALWSSDDE